MQILLIVLIRKRTNERCNVDDKDVQCMQSTRMISLDNERMVCRRDVSRLRDEYEAMNECRHE